MRSSPLLDHPEKQSDDNAHLFQGVLRLELAHVESDGLFLPLRIIEEDIERAFVGRKMGGLVGRQACQWEVL